MENLDIDDKAKKQAYIVIQRFGDDGLEAVQKIVSNILKNWQYVGNKSAFMASSLGEMHAQPRGLNCFPFRT